MNGDIINTDVIMIGINLPRPFPLAFGALSTLPRVFLVIDVSCDGLTFRCLGEASIDFPFSHYDAWDIYASLRELNLTDKNVNDRSYILMENRSLLKYPAAFAALNMALDDAYGRVNSVSVPSLYGTVRLSGDVLESVSIPSSVNALLKSYTDVKKRNHIVKLKGGYGVSKDVKFLKSLLRSNTIGDTKFAVDFNAAYTLDEFSQVVSSLSKCFFVSDKLLFFEQPTSLGEGLEGLSSASLVLKQKGIDVPVMADESFVTTEDALFCQSKGILLNFKIQKIGGIVVAKEIEEKLGPKALSSMVGGTFPTAIGRVWDQHALCVLRKAVLPSDGWEPSTDWFDGDLHFIEERFKNSAFIGNGLGVNFRLDLLERNRILDPKAEYTSIRNNGFGKVIKISLKSGVPYAELYEHLNNIPHDWNLK